MRFLINLVTFLLHAAVPPVHYARLAAYRARYYMEGNPPDAGTQDGDTLQKLPSVKENLKEVMFYCW